MSTPLEQAQELIPAEFRMISGCKDEQTSADVSNVASFSLPDPAGRAGGACTSAMLKVLYADHTKPDEDLTFQEVLMAMRGVLSTGSYEQIPQLTSSRPLDMQHPFNIVPDGFSGTKRALMIGINYIGQQGQLSGCHNDVGNMMEYIKVSLSLSDGNKVDGLSEHSADLHILHVLYGVFLSIGQYSFCSHAILFLFARLCYRMFMVSQNPTLLY
jgi:metacaspase-1